MGQMSPKNLEKHLARRADICSPRAHTATAINLCKEEEANGRDGNQKGTERKDQKQNHEKTGTYP